MIVVDVDAQGAQPRGRRGGPGRAPRPLDAARAALHHRRHGQVRRARLVRVRGRHHQRRRAPAGARRADPRLTRQRHEAKRPGGRNGGSRCRRTRRPGSRPGITPVPVAADRPGLVGVRMSATEQTGLDWPRHRRDVGAGGRGARGLAPAGCRTTSRTPRRTATGPAFESLTLAAALVAPRRRASGSGSRWPAATFRHPARPGEGGHRPRQRHRRAVHPGPRRGLARRRARRVRHPAAADPRSASTGSRARSASWRRCSPTRRGTEPGRHARRPASTRSATPPTSPAPCGPADR